MSIYDHGDPGIEWGEANAANEDGQAVIDAERATGEARQAAADENPVIAELDAITERNEQRIETLRLTEWTVNRSVEGDARRLVAALRFLLDAHGPYATTGEYEQMVHLLTAKDDNDA